MFKRAVGFAVKYHVAIAFIVILALGVAVRLYQFPAIPSGLNQDEVSASYEAYSLSTEGTDRWGYKLPVYFLSWGSGQNVLQSYLTTPVIKVLGLTDLSARLIPVLLGIASLPLIFLVARRMVGEYLGLLAMLTLALSPWHIILSRWGLESNLLPFFILLGVWLLQRALDHPSWKRILFCLAPFALGLYAYGIAVVVISLLIPMILGANFRTVWKYRRRWLAALGVSIVVASPLILFLVKNYVTHTSYSFESHLPFTVPLLPESRLTQAGGNILTTNAHFVAAGLTDGTAWNSVRGYLPLSLVTLLLAVIGVFCSLTSAIKARSVARIPIALWWLLASIPLFFVTQANINRVNSIFIPLILLSMVGLKEILSLLKKHRTWQRILLSAVVLLTIAYGWAFLGRYFSPAQQHIRDANFNPGLRAAMQILKQHVGKNDVYITDSISLNYVQTLYYLKVPQKQFMVSKPTYSSPDFGNFHFSLDASLEHQTYTFLARSGEKPCVSGLEQDVYHTNRWKVGTCRQTVP